MDKLGQMKIDGWTVLAALIVMYIFVAPVRNFTDGLLLSVGGGVDQPRTSGSTIECIYDGAVMTIGPVEKKYAPTTAITSVGHRVFVNGVDRGLKVDGSTLDVTYNDDIEIYYAANSTNSGTNSIRYYANKASFAVPCKSTFSTGDADVDTGKAIELISMKVPTLTVFNDDDGLKNSLTHPENITASDSANLELKLVKGSKGGFSPAGNQMICIKANSTLMDDIELSIISGVGSITKQSAVPTVVLNSNGYGSETGMALDCWEAAGTDSSSTITERYNILVETSTLTPASGDHHKQNSLNISVWDQGWYRNSESGEMELGYENDDNEDVGLATTANITAFMG